MLPNVASDRLIILNKGFHSQPEKCPLSVEWNPNINIYIYIYIWKIDNYEDDHSYFGRINHNPKIEMWWNGFVWHLPNCATILGSTLVDESWWRVWEFTIVHHSPPARSPAQNMKCKQCKPSDGSSSRGSHHWNPAIGSTPSDPDNLWAEWAGHHTLDPRHERGAKIMWTLCKP